MTMLTMAVQDETDACESFAGVLCNFLPEDMPERPTDFELELKESGYQVAQVHPLSAQSCSFSLYRFKAWNPSFAYSGSLTSCMKQ